MDNVTYIQHWFLENNHFLKDRQDKYEMLHILVFYVLVFESLEKINEDQIIKINHSYELHTLANGNNEEPQPKIMKEFTTTQV